MQYVAGSPPVASDLNNGTPNDQVLRHCAALRVQHSMQHSMQRSAV
jgi:hypothetical protein